jgi:hypothetical protein
VKAEGTERRHKGKGEIWAVPSLALNLSSLGISPSDRSGEVSVSRHHQEGYVGLRGPSDHVLDEVAVSRCVDDGVLLGVGEKTLVVVVMVTPRLRSSLPGSVKLANDQMGRRRRTYKAKAKAKELLLYVSASWRNFAISRGIPPSSHRRRPVVVDLPCCESGTNSPNYSIPASTCPHTTRNVVAYSLFDLLMENSHTAHL